MNYFFHLGIMLEIYVLLAIALNYILGYAGMLSLCQAMYYGIGAYVAALLGVKLDIPFLLILPAAMLFAGVSGWLVSLLARRLRDLYFALATLSVQVIFFSLTYNWVEVTRGPFGITGIPNPNILGWHVNDVPEYFLFGGIMLGLVLIFSLWFQKTSVCRMMRCVRDDAITVTSLGKDPEHYKALASIIGATISAISGVLYATYVTYIDPTSFTLDESILILSILMIGGSGNLAGPLAGAVIYILIPEALREFDLSNNVAANVRLIIFGLLLVALVRFRPNGIFGVFQIK